MKLKKELVDEVIRLAKKYYKTGEVDILPALNNVREKLEKECKSSYIAHRLISDLAMFTEHSGRGTYEDIYKALAIFGVLVE